MNSVELAVRDGVPYAIDFMNPAPDMDVNSLTPHVLRLGGEHMADLAIRLAHEAAAAGDGAAVETAVRRQSGTGSRPVDRRRARRT